MPDESKLAALLTKKVADLPVWAWGLIGVAGVGVGYFIIKKSSAAATAAQGIPAAPTDTTGGALTSPIGDVGSQVGTGTSAPSNPEINSYGAPTLSPGIGWTPIYDGNGNLVGWNAPPQPPPSGTYGKLAIRAAGSVPAYAAYDKSNPQGVPIRSSTAPTGPNVIGYAAFGSTVTPVGPLTNNMWHTSAGYISVHDVVNA